MNTYIALLRGINLGSHNRIAMPALIEACTGLGYTNVRAYLQSGNLIFTTTTTTEEIARRVEEMILRDFGHSVPVIVRSVAELGALTADNPYTRPDEITHLYVTFLAATTSYTPEKTLTSPTLGGTDTWKQRGNNIYIHCPGGYGRTKLNNSLFERKLHTTATTRNWKTVSALLDMTKEI
jgi:uncharacterized protein (DUF1697 family)